MPQLKAALLCRRAGILRIMRSKPTLAGGTGTISHNLTATSDSTGGDEPTTLAVT